MRILLDTHVVIWVFKDDPRVTNLRSLLLSDSSDVFVSAVSLWEIAIKIGIGKIDTNLSEFRQSIIESGFSELPMLGAHTEALLSLAPLHRDPFDRMLIAQAISEPMILITADEMLVPYSSLVRPLHSF